MNALRPLESMTTWGEVLQPADIDDPFGVSRALERLPAEDQDRFWVEWHRFAAAHRFDLGSLYYGLQQEAARRVSSEEEPSPMTDAWLDVFASTSRLLASQGLGHLLGSWLAEHPTDSAPPE